MQGLRAKSVLLRFVVDGVVNNKFYFNDDPDVNGSITKGIDILIGDGTELSASFSFTGQTTAPITLAQLKNFFITLCDNNGKIIYDKIVPYSLCSRLNNGTIRFFFDQQICLKKSYVTFLDATGIGSTTVIPANFYLLDK